MFKRYKKLLATIALTLTTALVVTLFSPVALAEEPEPSIPDLSNTICITIDEISPETKVSDLVSNTSLSDLETLEVYDKEGFQISNNGYVTNSSTIVIKNNGVVTEAYKVRLYGDLDCDGHIDTFDISQIKNCLAGITIEEIAADANADSIVDTVDLSVLKLYSAGIGNINQSRQFAFSSRFNWLSENKADYKIYGYTEEFSDLSVSSNDIDLTFSRYYDSCNTNIGILGKGWTASFEGSCLTYEGTSKIVSIYGQTPVVFECSNNEYSCEYSRSSLIATNSGYEYTGEDDLKYTFNSNGYLTKITDRNNNAVIIEVNSNGKIQKVTDSVGREYLYTYNSNGYLSKITDPVGRNVNYSYDSYNRLVSVTGVMGSITQKYGYTVADRLRTVYDAFDNILTQVNYDENGVVTSVTDSDGNTVNYSYNPSLNSISVSEDGSVTECYVYNRYNFLSIAINDEGKTENSFLNSYGDVIESIVEDVEKTSYILDADGNVLEVKTVTDEETKTEKNTYDNNGNLLTSLTDDEKYIYTYDSNGNVLTVTKQVNGEVTESATYTYNSKGLVVSDTEDGKITEYTYNANGYVITESEENGKVTNYTYDVVGNTLTESKENTITAYVYNRSGDLLRTTQDNVVKERTVYDSYGRILQQISEVEYNANYDKLNTDSKIDAYSNNGNEVAAGIRYYYGTNGKLNQIKASCYTINTDGAQKVTSVKAGNTVLASYNYTNDVKELLANVNYANGQSVSYTYDTEGNITALSYGNITAYTYTYDSEGILTTKNDLLKNVRTIYTENRVSVSKINTDSTLTEIYSYNSEELTDESEIDYEKTTESFNNNTFETDYYENCFKYDTYTHSTQLNDDELVSTIAVNNSSSNVLNSSYTYNDDNLPIGLINTYTNSNDIYSYAYDDNGNITSVIRNNKNKHYHYDNAGQLIRVDDEIAGNTVIYEYNGISGNIKSIKYYTYTAADTVSSAILSQKSFSYIDSNWRDLLTSIDGNALTYDALGNVISYNGYTYTWTAGRHLSQMTNGTDTINFKYDDNGIRTEKNVNGVTTHYTTIDGRITGQYDGTNTIYFRYTAENSLVGFNLNGNEYIYIKNIQGDIEGILDQNGNLVVQYTYDAWGKVLSTTGSLASTVGAINPMRYRDYYLDSETGYYYLQSRYYNPDICRFINADEPSLISLNITDASSTTTNLFTYCNNNPLNNIDPTGHYVIVDDIAILGVVVVVVMIVAVAISNIISKTQIKYNGNSYIRGILSQLKLLWNTITITFQTSAKIVQKAVEKNIAKATTVIKSKQKQDYYWIASEITFKRKNVKKTTYFPCMPISKSKAISYIRKEGNVFANTKSAARRLAIAVNGSPPVGPERSKSERGYFFHYHARKRLGAGNGGGHIFYL